MREEQIIELLKNKLSLGINKKDIDGYPTLKVSIFLNTEEITYDYIYLDELHNQ